MGDHALQKAPDGQNFTLKSGEKTPWFVDCRKLHLMPGGLLPVVNALWSEMHTVQFDCFGGPSLGADPIVGGLCYLAGITPNGRKMRAFLVRKEAKDYGVTGRVVGDVREGDRCVIIEDVVTTGGTTLSAVDAVESLGAKVVQIFAVVDRMAGGAERFAERGIPFDALLTLHDLLPITGCS